MEDIISLPLITEFFGPKLSPNECATDILVQIEQQVVNFCKKNKHDSSSLLSNPSKEVILRIEGDIVYKQNYKKFVKQHDLQVDKKAYSILAHTVALVVENMLRERMRTNHLPSLLAEAFEDARNSCSEEKTGLEAVVSNTLYELGKKGGSLFQYNLTIKTTKNFFPKDKTEFRLFFPLLARYKERNLDPQVRIIKREVDRLVDITLGEPSVTYLPYYKISKDNNLAVKMERWFFPITFNSRSMKNTTFVITLAFHIKNYAHVRWESIFFPCYDIFWFFSFQESGSNKTANIELRYPERTSFVHKDISYCKIERCMEKEDWKDEKKEWGQCDHRMAGSLLVDADQTIKVFIHSQCKYLGEWSLMLFAIVVFSIGVAVIDFVVPTSNILWCSQVKWLISWTLVYGILCVPLLRKFLP